MRKSNIATWAFLFVVGCLAPDASGETASSPPSEPTGSEGFSPFVATDVAAESGSEGSAPFAATDVAPESATATPSVTVDDSTKVTEARAAPPKPSAAVMAPKSAKPEPPQAHGAWGSWDKCKEPEGEVGTSLSTDCSGVFGLRGSITHARGASGDDAMGITIHTQGEEYVRRGLWTARSLHQFVIGGGTAGFEATLLGGWAGGIRLPVDSSRRHGPLLRLGMYGYLRGNGAFYGSLLELPQLQLGYQYQKGKTVMELGATTGAVLTGRSRVGDTRRRVLGAGFEYGGYAALQVPWLRLGVSVQRLPVDDELSNPVNVAEGTLCGRAAGFAICTDARATFSQAIVGTSNAAAEQRSLYVGLTLGVTRE